MHECAYTESVDVEWDGRKAATNLRKHGVDFADAATALYDGRAATIRESSTTEDRFVSLGMDALGRVLVVVFTWRGDAARLISARKAQRACTVRGQLMKREYDFSQGERGAPITVASGETRITIRIDDDILAWFKQAAHNRGGGSYQTMINAALRDHIDTRKEHLEQTLRRVIREELPRELKRAASQ